MTYLSTAYSCIIQNSFRREGKDMAAIESTGTSSKIKIKEQYESMRSLLDYCGVKIGDDVK